MWTSSFWKAAAERATKAFAHSLLTLFFVGDLAFNVLEFSWLPALGIALGASLSSILVSIVSANFGPTGSPSLVVEEPYGRHAA